MAMGRMTHQYLAKRPLGSSFEEEPSFLVLNNDIVSVSSFEGDLLRGMRPGGGLDSNFFGSACADDGVLKEALGVNGWVER